MSLDTISQLPWLSRFSLLMAVVAAVILVWYLIRRPPLVRTTKIALLLGVGVLPVSAGLTGSVAGYQRTMDREFCGSCHTMGPYVADSNDPDSKTLAAIHGRNEMFGAQNCYTCHADYGMFGTVATKLSGMKHVWEYYTKYRSIPVEEALPTIHLYKPYPNANCMHCHSTATPGWLGVPEHESALELTVSGELSCVSAGCHGPAHPFSKVGRDEEEAP